ncbi:MAG: lysylphosphatidylglycerol synthase transmembrane domain-containing protein [Microthrixaceae bacterium]
MPPTTHGAAPAHRPAGERVERSRAELRDLVRRLHVTPWTVAAGAIAILVVELLVLWANHLPSDISREGTLHWWWVAAAVAIIPLMWVGYAISLAAAAEWTPPFGRTVQLEVAEALTLVVTPLGTGSLTLSLRFLTRTGMDSSAAAGACGLSSFLTTVVSTIALPVAAAFAASSLDTDALRQDVPSSFWIVVLGVLVLAVGTTVVVRAPTLRKEVGHWLGRAGHFVRRAVARPTTGLAVAGGQLVTMAAQVACAAFLLTAVGAPVNLAALVVITQLAGAASSVVPVPGGLGAPEAVLIAGMAAVGVPHDAAIVASLLYRMLTYWLPMIPGAGALYDLFRRNYV